MCVCVCVLERSRHSEVSTVAEAVVAAREEVSVEVRLWLGEECGHSPRSALSSSLAHAFLAARAPGPLMRGLERLQGTWGGPAISEHWNLRC